MKNVIRKNVNGFTLIELLVVIAIIAILAAILFPVFGRARENARRSTCLSNLKQIGLGVMQYNSDYDSFFPPYLSLGPAPDGKQFLSDADGGQGLVFWQQSIYPYVKSHSLFFCPNSPSKIDSAVTSENVKDREGRMLWGNYGASSHLFGELSAGKKESAVLDIAGTYAIAEFGFYYFAQLTMNQANYAGVSDYLPGAGRVGATCNTGRPEFKADCESGRHFDGITMMFADGHAKWLKTTVVRSESLKANGAWNPLVNH
jgi:prepilin-type N-terminal cleavage/methylation domain-containing protein